MLDKKYFNEYGLWDDELNDGEDVTYDKTWKQFTFHPGYLLKVFKNKIGEDPKSFLDLGAANGKYLKTILDKGIDSLGIENNKYIYNKIEDKDVKERIKFGDVISEIKKIKDNSFDVILESCVQYLKPVDITKYLKNVYKVTNKICFILIDFNEWSDKPHEGQVTYKNRKWWFKKIKNLGFKKCYTHAKGFICVK